MTLHENDWQVIVYQHLKLAFELLRRGIIMDWDNRNSLLGYGRQPAEYLNMIRCGLEEENRYLDEDTITLSGCQFLVEDDC